MPPGLCPAAPQAATGGGGEPLGRRREVSGGGPGVARRRRADAGGDGHVRRWVQEEMGTAQQHLLILMLCDMLRDGLDPLDPLQV
jgi:hypothetical protein